MFDAKVKFASSLNIYHGKKQTNLVSLWQLYKIYFLYKFMNSIQTRWGKPNSKHITNFGLYKGQQFSVGIYLNGLNSISTFTFGLSKILITNVKLVAILFFGQYPFSNLT